MDELIFGLVGALLGGGMTLVGTIIVNRHEGKLKRLERKEERRIKITDQIGETRGKLLEIQHVINWYFWIAS